jgi:hypothetical protein
VHELTLSNQLVKYQKQYEIAEFFINLTHITKSPKSLPMKKVVLFLLLISIVACKKENDTIPDFSLDQADHLTADEYDIYSVILKNFSFSHLIVRQQTSTNVAPKEGLKIFFELEQTANMDQTLYPKFVTENSNTYLLDDKIEIADKDVILISNKEYEYLFEREDHYKAWELFESKYPNSGKWYISLNKISFNEDKTQAMVGSESHWFRESPEGPTLNWGMIYHLQKKDNGWEVIGYSGYRP